MFEPGETLVGNLPIFNHAGLAINSIGVAGMNGGAGEGGAVVLQLAQILAGPGLDRFLDPKINAGNQYGLTIMHETGVFEKTEPKTDSSKKRYTSTKLL